MNVGRIISFLFGCVCMLIYIIVGVCCAHADVCPQCLDDIPIYGFVLPVFDVAGVKLFDAYGKSATPSADGSCFVKDAKLVFFTGDNGIGKICAVSDFSTVYQNSHYAVGDSPVHIFGENFFAKGDTWEFFGDSKKIIAKGNVEVVLNGNLIGE